MGPAFAELLLEYGGRWLELNWAKWIELVRCSVAGKRNGILSSDESLTQAVIRVVREIGRRNGLNVAGSSLLGRTQNVQRWEEETECV